MAYKVAVVSATAVLSREILNILHARYFPVSDLVPLASRRSVGKDAHFGDRTPKVRALEDFDFTGTDIALLSAGGATSQPWAPPVSAQSAVVLDTSTQRPTDPDVPTSEERPVGQQCVVSCRSHVSPDQ